MSATCLGMCTRERRRTSRLRSICAHVMLPAPAKGMAGGANTSCIASTSWRGASVTDVETCMVPYSPDAAPSRVAALYRWYNTCQP